MKNQLYIWEEYGTNVFQLIAEAHGESWGSEGEDNQRDYWAELHYFGGISSHHPCSENNGSLFAWNTVSLSKNESTYDIVVNLFVHIPRATATLHM